MRDLLVRLTIRGRLAVIRFLSIVLATDPILGGY